MIINEHLLPNPFKQAGSELANVLDNIERDLLARDNASPLPSFLDASFLEKLEAEITAAKIASVARKKQGYRIVARLRSQLRR